MIQCFFLDPGVEIELNCTTINGEQNENSE